MIIIECEIFHFLAECERGLTRLENTCVFISNLRRTYKHAKAVCTNLGLQLEMPANPEDRTRLATMLNAKGKFKYYQINI